MHKCPICGDVMRSDATVCGRCTPAYAAGMTFAKQQAARLWLSIGAQAAHTNGLSHDDIKLATGLRAPGRNEVCPCGSGKKAKRCCLKPTKGASDE